jgi:hypothetical protein
VVDLAVAVVVAVVDRLVVCVITAQEMVGLEAVAEVRVERVEQAVMEEVLPLEFTSMLMAPMEVWLIVSFKQET